MSKNNLVEYCLILNQRIIDIEKYSQRFQEINLENEENKKQIIYLKNKLKRVIDEAEKINEINNNNKVVINSQNRTIEKYQKNKLNELGINIIDNNNNNELITKRKTLHFNKSQINLKTYNNNIYNEIYNKNKNRNKNNNNIFLKQKTINNIKGKKIKELQIPFDYIGVNSDNQTIDTNNYNDLISLKSNEYKNKNLKKNMLSASYTNFYSQN